MYQISNLVEVLIKCAIKGVIKGTKEKTIRYQIKVSSQFDNDD